MSKIKHWIKNHQTAFILICILIYFILVGLSGLVLHTGYTDAIPSFDLANTSWICTIENDGMSRQLHLEFNNTGTILQSRERGYEFIKQQSDWKKIDYSVETGYQKVESGYVFVFEKKQNQLIITQKTEFSNVVMAEWICQSVE